MDSALTANPVILLSDSDEEGNVDLTDRIIAKASAHKSVQPQEMPDSMVKVRTSAKKIKKKKSKKKASETEEKPSNVIEIHYWEDKGLKLDKTPSDVKSHVPSNHLETPDVDEPGTVPDIKPESRFEPKKGIRYFTPSWEVEGQACYRCGGVGHAPKDCVATPRVKPCYVCSSLEHQGKDCPKLAGLKKSCYVCKQPGHLGRDCPDKNRTPGTENEGDERKSDQDLLCLKCAEPGHDFKKCQNDYDKWDIQYVQCYVCRQLGHLCCAKILLEAPVKTTCYGCGKPGHVGEVCSKPRGPSRALEDLQRPAQTCYACGQEGHIARGCSQGQTFKKRKSWPLFDNNYDRNNNDPFKTPTGKRDYSQHDDRSYQKSSSRRRGGWDSSPKSIAFDDEDYGDNKGSQSHKKNKKKNRKSLDAAPSPIPNPHSSSKDHKRKREDRDRESLGFDGGDRVRHSSSSKKQQKYRDGSRGQDSRGEARRGWTTGSSKKHKK